MGRKGGGGNKYYAVSNGRSTGVYNNWSDCQSQVNGYSGAVFKSFSTYEAAANFSQGGTYGGNYNSSGRSSSSSSSSYGGGSYGGSSGGGSYGGGSYGGGSASRSSYSSSSSSSSGGYGYGYGGGSSRSYSSSSSRGDGQSSKRDVVYTDGSSLSNGRAGARAGWGVYWGENDSRNSYGKVETGDQTNNRGELTAIRQAVREINRSSQPGKSYEIRADSQYSKNSLTTWADNWETNGWKTSAGKPVKNQDLIQEIRGDLQQLNDRNVSVDLTYVEAHAGHAGNEAADVLAKKGASG